MISSLLNLNSLLIRFDMLYEDKELSSDIKRFNRHQIKKKIERYFYSNIKGSKFQTVN